MGRGGYIYLNGYIGDDNDHHAIICGDDDEENKCFSLTTISYTI